MYTVCMLAPMALTVRRAAHWLIHEISFLKTIDNKNARKDTK